MRKQRIANYRAEIDLNNILLGRLDTLRNKVKTDGRTAFSNEVARLKEHPSDDKPPTGHAKQPTYDEMMLQMLLKVLGECKEELGKKYGALDGDQVGEDKWVDALVRGLDTHENGLKERSEECDKLAKEEEEEQSRKITSETIKDGWSSGVSPCEDVSVLVLTFVTPAHQQDHTDAAGRPETQIQTECQNIGEHRSPQCRLLRLASASRSCQVPRGGILRPHGYRPLRLDAGNPGSGHGRRRRYSRTHAIGPGLCANRSSGMAQVTGIHSARSFCACRINDGLAPR